MTLNEENEIVERVLNGDRDAYASLVDAYKSAIFNLAFRMTGSDQDADDLAQETFFRAYRNLGQFCPGKRFFTWFLPSSPWWPRGSYTAWVFSPRPFRCSWPM